MALEKCMITKHGITLDKAYLKIIEQGGTKDNINISLGIYSSAEAKESGFELIDVKKYDFTPSVANGAPNFIKQGYEYLKTLSDYADAVDILES
jgi:hypothetical protein